MHKVIVTKNSILICKDKNSDIEIIPTADGVTIMQPTEQTQPSLFQQPTAPKSRGGRPRKNDTPAETAAQPGTSFDPTAPGLGQ